jgi:hypothetical protein
MARKKLIAVAIMAMTTMSAGYAGSASASPQAAPVRTNPNTAVVHQSAQKPEAVRAYWTPSRMRAARNVTVAPRVVPGRRAGQAAAPTKVPPQSHLLPSQGAPGGLPVAPRRPHRAAQAPAPIFDDITQSGVWYAHGQMPASTVGKLYFTTPRGPSECTATVVASNNRSLIWTAGHCVSNGARGWYSNFLFVPDYYDGNWPLGSWAWKSVSSPSAYFDGGNADYDLAAITLWPQNGARVADRTGFQGYKFNWGYNWYAYEFGYPYNTHPARPGITGQQLRFCVGSTWRPGFWPFLSNQQAIHCDQGSGASGGPWLDDLQFGRGWGYLVGNVSYHLSESSDEERSPHFGDAAVNVYNAQTNV